METLEFDYPAGQRAVRRARVGVVASGDLEILAVPRTDDRATVRVTTSVDGFGAVWRDVLDGFFADAPLAVDVVVHDAGATPGTVALRLAQLKESATA
jgi:malonate decarboxylase delta subunit